MIRDLPDTNTSEVLRALVQIREEGGAIALGRVLTLIIDSEVGHVDAAVAVTNDVSREHPARVIVLARDPGRTTTRLDAQIRVGGDAGASEVVVLTASGELLTHSDTLVLPLLLPDAPIVIWWPHEVPDRPSEHPIGAMAHRRITDSMSAADPMGTLTRLRSGYAAGDSDLAWTRLTVWRAYLAAALDLPPFEPVQRAEVSGHEDSPAVYLLAAWLAHTLDCPVDIHRQRDVQGLTKVVLDRPSGPVVIDRSDARTAQLIHPGQPERWVAMPLRELRECLSEDLRRLDPDVVYGEVLLHGLERVK